MWAAEEAERMVERVVGRIQDGWMEGKGTACYGCHLSTVVHKNGR